MSSVVRVWSPFPNSRNTSRFRRIVFDELAKRNLAVTGAPPVLVLSSGRMMYLDNVALRCTTVKRAEWPEIVGEFLDTIVYLDSIEDPTAQSPEVARASLRLRLAVPVPVDTSSGNASPRTRNPVDPLDPDDPADPLGMIDVLQRPAMPGTVWLLYLQIPGAAFGVTADHLAGWGIGIDEAFELARLHAAGAPMPRVREKGCVRLLDSSSMFTHTAVLHPGELIESAPDGWFVAVPSREQVLAVRAAGTEDGLAAMVDLVRESAVVGQMSGYPLSRSPWYVPPAGIGPFGEEAELVALHFDPIDGTLQRVRMGPRVHELFGVLEDRR